MIKKITEQEYKELLNESRGLIKKSLNGWTQAIDLLDWSFKVDLVLMGMFFISGFLWGFLLK